MSLRLWKLAALALPIFVILALQAVGDRYGYAPQAFIIAPVLVRS